MFRWLLLATLGLSIGARPSRPVLVVHNYYYAKPTLADSVYLTRLEASSIRRRAGLVVGTVLRRTSGPDSLPDVIWEAEYSDSAARGKDVAALDGNQEFEAIQARMDRLIRRFERSTWTTER